MKAGTRRRIRGFAVGLIGGFIGTFIGLSIFFF